ncbi:MAG: hypothetical protein IPJ33_16885 [Gammaproteobacteria bacterium]|jgi:hypothetical protein|nr:hypothetical protein [Gammaproteobacteria bacterium]MBP6051762.1 hypothetical protein [Pseudomonadales bacterium]MBK6583013.1 hypothetical protein [Gammaproteobacteria bacterium]MBK7168102.1 hypothetical protein [Gammaproteobacteria bacterium]MBK7519140.1 hypothetical protein [Gammaproteobacteria bacterium]
MLRITTRFLISILVCGAVHAAPDAACLSYCEQAEADCSLSVRQSSKDCARRAATGGVDPFTQRREDSLGFCGYFGAGHCASPYAGERCQQRFRDRYALCSGAYLQNTSAEYLQCSDSERRALAMCRDEMADCRAAC